MEENNTYIVDLKMSQNLKLSSYVDPSVYLLCYEMEFNYARLVGVDFYSKMNCRMKFKNSQNNMTELLEIMEKTIKSLYKTVDFSKNYNFAVITKDAEKIFAERVVSKFISNLKKENFDFEVEQI